MAQPRTRKARKARKPARKPRPAARTVACASSARRNKYIGAVIHLQDGHWRVLGCNTRTEHGGGTYTIQNLSTRRRKTIAKSTVATLARRSPEDVELSVGAYAPPAPGRQAPRGVPVAASRVTLASIDPRWAQALRRAKAAGRRVIIDGEGRVCNLRGEPFEKDRPQRAPRSPRPYAPRWVDADSFPYPPRSAAPTSEAPQRTIPEGTMLRTDGVVVDAMTGDPVESSDFTGPTFDIDNF